MNQLGLIMRRKEYAEDFIRWAAIYSLFERVLATNAEKDPLTALKWPMTERVMNEGTGHIWKRYNLPIYITENGQSCKRPHLSRRRGARFRPHRFPRALSGRIEEVCGDG